MHWEDKDGDGNYNWEDVTCPEPPPNPDTVNHIICACVDHLSYFVVGFLEVNMDIKPGSNPNCIKAINRGRVPVAILGSLELDVNDFDELTIEVDQDNDSITPGVPPVKTGIKDVDSDGINDLVLHFSTEALSVAGLLTDGLTLYLTGTLIDGTAFVGSDIIYLAGGPNCFD